MDWFLPHHFSIIEYMLLVITIFFFIFGLIIGSFLNVVIYRFNTGKTLGGRSSCMSCQNKIYWYDLVPLFSFLVLKGRCRSCRGKISIQYPVVEFITGLIFVGLFLKYKYVFFTSSLLFSVDYAYYITIFCLLLVIAVYDLKHKIIPDTLSIVFSILAFVGMFFFSALGGSAFGGNYIFHPHIPSILEFLSGVFIALPFAFFWLVSRGAWMGFGDVKLALGLGFLLGLGKGLSAIVFAFWSGAIVGIFLLFFSRSYKMKSEIPFAPFLVLGAFLAYLLEVHLFPIGF
jgi:leader peptidase (prepilin peptidase)/N-methyltransferase